MVLVDAQLKSPAVVVFSPSEFEGLGRQARVILKTIALLGILR